MSTKASNSAELSVAENSHITQTGATLRDPRSGANRTDGGEHPDILISDAGNDMLNGKGGVDTYVINNTNYDRVVTIKDKGINWLAFDEGTRMMKMDIQKNAVLLDGKPLERADNSTGAANTFILKIENLTLLIKPDYGISNKSDVKTTETDTSTNPIWQNMSNLPIESKLAALNHLHAQMLKQQILRPETDLNKNADNQLG